MTDRKSLIERITASFPELSPQLKQAARHVLERPEDVAIESMRGLAALAGVPPSTMVRLAKATGFASWEEFRKVFQEAVRSGESGLVTRAEWLQRLPVGDRAGEVVGGMARAILGNVETAFRESDMAALTEAADLLCRARRVHVVGVGGMHAIASYLHYVARMALPDVRLAAPAMATMIDELAELGPSDVVAILSVEPYAVETVRTAHYVAETGAALVAITDSRAAPVAALARALLLVPTQTPQFFPSQAATIALVETLIALVVSHGDKAVLERIDRVDRHRKEQGIYWRG